MAEFVNSRVYELLPDQKTRKDVVSVIGMKCFVDEGARTFDRLSAVLELHIYETYGVEHNAATIVAKKTAADFIRRYGVQMTSAPVLNSKQVERLEIAFTKTEYIGDASSKFKAYLERCWKMYRTNPELYKAPYVSVVQSSGFGKSRMLYELALMALKRCSQMKVLYVCARTQESTGYPKATPELRKWLFHIGCTPKSIATRLKVIFQHAVDNWETVQDEWLKIFTSTDADTNAKGILYKKLSSRDRAFDKKKNSRVVILVIDETRSLLAEREDCSNHFRMLRRALDSISQDAGVFVVLIDTHPTVCDFASTQPMSSDPSSRLIDGKELASVPPFVMTHTMDVFWAKCCDEQVTIVHGNDKMEKDKQTLDTIVYKAAVTGSEQDAWNA